MNIHRVWIAHLAQARQTRHKPPGTPFATPPGMKPADDHPQPQHWYSTNLVGVPASVLVGTRFNQQPAALAIAGTRQAHHGLFNLLARSQSLEEAGEVFDHYLSIAFALKKPSAQEMALLCVHEGQRWRSSWRKLLQGWGMDSNASAGAVLKGWVESRFGMVPVFHKTPLGRFPSPAWEAYLQEKTTSRYHSNSIYQQLDLLYEFTQWALRRFALPPARSPYWPDFAADTAMANGLGAHPPSASANASANTSAVDAPEATHLRLWRGSTRAEEQLVSGSLRERRCTIRLNNIASFSRSRQAASCFGDWVFEAQVPLAKVVVAPGVLPGQVLQGEQEVLALGGDYEVEASYV